MGLLFEDAVGAEVFAVLTVSWVPQVDRRVGIVRSLGLLRTESGLAQVAVEQTWSERIRGQRAPDPILASSGMVSCV